MEVLADSAVMTLAETAAGALDDIYSMVSEQEARYQRRHAKAALITGWGLAGALLLLFAWWGGWRPSARMAALAAKAAQVTARQCSDFVASVEAFLRTEGY